MPAISSCPHAKDCERLVRGELDVEDVRRLVEHIAHCDRCAAAVHQTLGSAPGWTVPPASEAPVPEDVARGVRDWFAQLRGTSTHSEHDAGNTPSAAPGGDGAGPADDTATFDFLAPPQAPDELGRLGPYRVLGVLGRGGMGVVFRAEDPQLERPVALKALQPALSASAAARQRFLREARLAASLDHPHVVPIYQVGEDRGVPFLAMPLLQGESLEDRLRRAGPLPVPEVLRIGREVAEGLAAAHARGLIHRDIKPANIWLEQRPALRSGAAPVAQVKLLDFGLARTVGDAGQLTQAGTVLGTPAYMAPEQTHSAELDPRSDLFSLGCVLYRLATGELPFRGPNAMAILLAVTQHEPRPVRELNPAVPPALGRLIMRLLRKDPAERPASADAVIAALEQAERELAAQSGEPVDTVAQFVRKLEQAERELAARSGRSAPGPAGQVSPPPAARRGGRQGPWVAAGVVALLVGTLIAASVFYLRTRHGTLVVEVTEPDVKVFIDGEEKVAIESSKVGRVELIPGEHTLTVKRGAKELYTTQFSLKSGDTEVIKARWEPRAVAATAAATDRWAETVAALPPEQQVKAVAARLKERNPGFDGKLTPNIDRDRVVGLSFLVDAVTDLTPLRALPALEALTCNGGRAGAGRLADLGPLRGLRLGYLSITNTAVADLSPLKGMPLHQLHCPGTHVQDLSPLRGMPLTALDCEHTPVTDLSPLQGLPLKTLTCDFRPERDAAILRAIPTLETINRLPAAEFWKKAEAARSANSR